MINTMVTYSIILGLCKSTLTQLDSLALGGWHIQAAFQPGTTLLFVAFDIDGNLRCFDVSKDNLNLVNTMITGYPALEGVIFFSHAPQYGILSFSSSGLNIFRVDSATSQILTFSLASSLAFRMLSLSPSETRLLCGTWDVYVGYYSVTAQTNLQLIYQYNSAGAYFEGVNFITEQIALISDLNTGIFQFIVSDSSISQQYMLVYQSQACGITFIPGTTNGGLFAIQLNNAIYNFIWDSISNTISVGTVAFTAMAYVAMASYNQDATKLVVVGLDYIYLLSTGNPPYCLAVDGTGNCKQCVGTLNSLQSRILPSCNCPPGFYSDSPYSQDCLSCPSNGCLSCIGILQCDVCKASQPVRAGALCLCPSGYYDDGVNGQCQVSSTSFSCYPRQISIIPNSAEDRLLFACDSSGMLYYSIDSSFQFSLLQSILESNAVRGVQYNPSDTTKFVATIPGTGIKTYQITNDVITGQNLLSIGLDFVFVKFFGSGSYVATVCFSQAIVCIASVYGSIIQSNYNQQIAEASYCLGITIINDFDCYLACQGGVFRYRLTAYNMFYIGQAYQGISSFGYFQSGISFFPNQALYGFMTDNRNGYFIFFQNNWETTNFTLGTLLNIAVQNAADTAFFQTKPAFITSSYNPSLLTTWTYCPSNCDSCDASNACISCLPQHYDTGSNTCQNQCQQVDPQCTNATVGTVLDTTSNFTGWHLSIAFQPGTEDVYVSTINSGQINVYDISADTLNLVYNWNSGYDIVSGFQFFYTDPEYAIIVCPDSGLSVIKINSLINITIQLSISLSGYDFRTIDFSPKETRAVVGSWSSNILTYYSISTFALSLLFTYQQPSLMINCQAVTYISDITFLAVCWAQGVYQFNTNSSAVILQALLTTSTNYQIIFYPGSNTQGIIAQCTYSFNTFAYSQSGQFQLGQIYYSFDNYAFSIAFNEQTTRVVFVGYDSIQLVKLGSIAFCVQYNADTSCGLCAGSQNLAQSRQLPHCLCPVGYYSNVPTTYDCVICSSTGCATCSSNSSCDTCQISIPSRTGALCSCPSGFFDDGVNAQCQVLANGPSKLMQITSQILPESHTRQISIIPNDQENRVLIALTSNLLYYAIDSNYSFTLLQSMTELQMQITGVQYNPNNASYFLSCYTYGGVRSYEIANDYASPQQFIPISADLIQVAHYANASLALVNSYVETTLYVISVDGYGIYLANQYNYTIGTNCISITILSDQIALLGCDLGIQQFNLDRQSISYQGEALSGWKAINDLKFFPNQSYYALFNNWQYCKFYLGTYDHRNLITADDTVNISLSSCTGAEHLAFFQTKNYFITSQYQTTQMVVWSYCTAQCASCDSSNNCTSCIQQHYSTQSQCNLWCDYRCLTCTTASICLTCVNSTMLRIPNNTCACPNQFYDIFPNSTQCQPCIQTCLNCTNGSQCIACLGSTGQNSSRLDANCTCPPRYFDNLPSLQECQECPFQCLLCTNLTYCTQCVFSIPARSGNDCTCPVGYYGTLNQCVHCLRVCASCVNSTACETCVNSTPARNGTLCTCPQGYYDDQINSQCQNCSDACLNCSLNASACLSCVGVLNSAQSRQLNMSCNCPVYGFYDDLPQIQDCQPCSLDTCLTCTNSSSCQSCIGDLNQNYSRLLPNCSCPAGYYSNISKYDNCITCPIYCTNCKNSSFCTSCSQQFANGNLQLSNFSTFTCPSSLIQPLINTNFKTQTQPLYLSTCCSPNCYANFYFNTSEQSCLPCDETCLTCSLSSTNCTSCNTTKNQQLVNFQCVCKPGFTSNSNNSCIAIVQTTSLPSNIPVIQSYIDQADQFPIINITFPVPIQQQFYADDTVQNLQVQIAKLTVQQDYYYNVTIKTVNYIILNFYFAQSIGQVNIQVNFPNTVVPDIYNRIIPLTSINYPFGPYLILSSQSQKQQIQNIQNSANAVIKNQFTEVLRSVSFIAYFLVSVQMTFSLLLINTVYPQNFYEVLRLLCATYIPTIPPYNELNEQYSYNIFYISVNVQLQTSLPSLQIYSLGFSGQLILDNNHQIIELIFIWSIFLFVVKKLHTKYKEQIEKGEKKYLSFVYIFTFQTIVKIHESIFGITFYSLLLQLSCMTFLNALGAISFLISIVVTAYLIVISTCVWSIISNQDIQISWINEYFEPLIARQGLKTRPQNSKNYNLIKYFQLYSYVKKCLVMCLIFFGSGSGNFQLISVLVVYTLNLLFIVYINPYKNRIYTITKLLGEISMIILLIVLLIATNKLQELMQESVLNTDDVNYVNSLGWAAAWILCAFNIFCLLMILLDYTFYLIDYLQKLKLDRSQNNNMKYNNLVNNNYKLASIHKNIQQQYVDIELKQTQKKNVSVQDSQDQNHNQNNKKINKFFGNKRSYNLNQINDPKSMSLLRNFDGQSKQQKLSLNQSHVKFIKYSQFFTINQYNKYIENKNYLIEYTNYFQDKFKCTILSYEIINEKLLDDIEKLKKIDQKIKNNLICINSQINQKLSMQVSKFIQQLQEIVYEWRIQPHEIVIKWKELAYQNQQAVQLLKMQSEPRFQNLVQNYGPQFMSNFKKQMLVIEKSLISFLNATSNQERIQQGYDLCKICQNLLIQIKITIFCLLISTQQQEEIFFESFEAIDRFYQENSQFPVRLARRVENELLYLTQQFPEFVNSLNSISSNIHQQQHKDQLLNLNDIIQKALQIFMDIGGITVGSTAQDKVERLLSIRSNDVRQAVILIRNEIDKEL